MKYYSTLLVVQTPFSYTCKFGQYAPFKTNTNISNSSTKCNNSAFFELELHGDLRFSMEVHSNRLKKLFFILIYNISADNSVPILGRDFFIMASLITVARMTNKGGEREGGLNHSMSRTV